MVNFKIEIEVECDDMMIAKYYASCATEVLDDKHIPYNLKIIPID